MVARRYARRPRKRTMRRKRMTITRAPRRSEGLTLQRTFNHSFWQPSAVSTSDFWKHYAFRYQDLPSYAEFAALFDQVRITRIKVVFRPRFESFDGANTTDVVAPLVTNQAGCNLHIINDPYSTTSPSGTYTRTNLNTFLENGKVRSYNGNKAVTVSYKPTTYITLDGSATGKLVTAPWQQISANPQYYGFFAFAQDFNMNGSFGQSWDVFVTFTMNFKGVK